MCLCGPCRTFGAGVPGLGDWFRWWGVEEGVFKELLGVPAVHVVHTHTPGVRTAQRWYIVSDTHTHTHRHTNEHAHTHTHRRLWSCCQYGFEAPQSTSYYSYLKEPIAILAGWIIWGRIINIGMWNKKQTSFTSDQILNVGVTHFLILFRMRKRPSKHTKRHIKHNRPSHVSEVR